MPVEHLQVMRRSTESNALPVFTAGQEEIKCVEFVLMYLVFGLVISRTLYSVTIYLAYGIKVSKQ